MSLRSLISAPVLIVPPSRVLGRAALAERGPDGALRVLLSSALTPDERAHVLGTIAARRSAAMAANASGHAQLRAFVSAR